MARILILQGHPDGKAPHLCHALADAYAESAQAHGHHVRRIDVGRIEFPFLLSQKDWFEGTPPAVIGEAQANLAWAEHVLILYPLWLGDMPGKLKAFLEQMLRPGFAVSGGKETLFRPLLSGRSARVVVTMSMPSLLYRCYFFAHSLRALKRNILAFVGIRPIRTTLIGGVGSMSKARCEQWLDEMRRQGALAA